jgi:TRAP-type C4-dicarboxylate transport system substrate-binding protein
MVRYATTFPGGLYNTSFVFMMSPAKYNALKPEEKAAIDKVSGENAARLFAAGWDRTDAASRDIQKTTGVQRQMASDAFVNEVKAKQVALEDKWVAAAEAKGLKNARAVLDEFRAETQKLK